MAVTNTGSFPKALLPGVKGWWGRGYSEHEQQWTELFDTGSSEKNYEEYVAMTGYGLVPVKGEGQSTSYDADMQGPVTRISNVAYSLGYIVTREEMDDNQYEKVANSRARALGFSFKQTKETVAANVYNRAFNSSYTGGDGVCLINTAHGSPAGGTFSNRLAVDADLSEASLEDMAIMISQAVDYRGNKIALKASKLIIPVAEQFNAKRILTSTGQSGTATNDINAIKAMGTFSGGVAVNNFLTASHAWFVRTNVPSDGMIYQKRIGIEFKSDNDFDTDNAKFKGYERYGFGWADPLGLYGSNGP